VEAEHDTSNLQMTSKEPEDVDGGTVREVQFIYRTLKFADLKFCVNCYLKLISICFCSQKPSRVELKQIIKSITFTELLNTGEGVSYVDVYAPQTLPPALEAYVVEYRKSASRRKLDLFTTTYFFIHFENIYFKNVRDVENENVNDCVFSYSVKKVSRIVRVLRQPNQHAIIAGPMGVGRRQMCKLASFMLKGKVKNCAKFSNNFILKAP
jgi:hypothetical protein